MTDLISLKDKLLNSILKGGVLTCVAWLIVWYLKREIEEVRSENKDCAEKLENQYRKEIDQKDRQIELLSAKK